MRTLRISIVAGLCAGLSCSTAPAGQVGSGAGGDGESALLRNHVQITFPDRFTRAGEAYFCPDAEWIIFQATERPADGREPSPHYAMYAAALERDHRGRVTGAREPILLSKPGSANTCGWFHPLRPWWVLFSSTLGPPVEADAPGYSRDRDRYTWRFPDNMQIVKRPVPGMPQHPRADDPDELMTLEFPTEAEPIFKRDGYTAEASWSPCGRFILYTQVEPATNDPNIWIYDEQTGEHHPIVTATGYDGGPFFSPCGAMICYRSDRRGNNLLQLFVGVLDFNDDGVPVGLKAEHQLTDNQHVNWAPFWHPSGEFLVYATSEISHRQYEVFAIEVDLEKDPADLRTRRITHSPGFDGLPVFSSDGKLMMWTSHRGGAHGDDERPTSQVWIAEVVPAAMDSADALFGAAEQGR